MVKRKKGVNFDLHFAKDFFEQLSLKMKMVPINYFFSLQYIFFNNLIVWSKENKNWGQQDNFCKVNVRLQSIEWSKYEIFDSPIKYLFVAYKFGLNHRLKTASCQNLAVIWLIPSLDLDQIHSYLRSQNSNFFKNNCCKYWIIQFNIKLQGIFDPPFNSLFDLKILLV